MQIASIVPSSGTLVRRVASKFDFSVPRTIAEFGPGEGCHSREIVRRMHPNSRLLLFELDSQFAGHLERQFARDSRVEIINADAQSLPLELSKRNIPHCDYVLSGIPFSILEIGKKRGLLKKTFESLAPHSNSAFVIYQVTNELRRHAHHPALFPRAESEYCLQNLPPMFITVFYKQGLNGNGHANGNGNGHKLSHAAKGVERF
jgi:phospholipid N-methyltransferase